LTSRLATGKLLTFFTVYLSTRNIIVDGSRPIVSIRFIVDYRSYFDWRIAELERELEQREEQADTLTRLEGPVCLMPVLFIKSHCKENPIYVLSEKKQRGLSPNFHIHVSVNIRQKLFLCC
jgi:hypothetical protein